MSAYGLKGFGDNGYGGLTMGQIEITLEEKGNLTVTAIDGGGNALSGVSVELSGPSSATGETGSSGTVTFDPLKVGEYALTASKSGYFTTDVTVPADKIR